jgi:hypothetical protein
MAETYEIKKYSYYVYSSRENCDPITVVQLYWDADKYLGAAFFSDNFATPLKSATKYPSGQFGLYHRVRELPTIIDMLRNEKPVFLIYDGTTNTKISTTTEPIGEGET